MTAFSGLGETQLAIDAFEFLRRQLADTYGVQPSPRTRALYLQVVTAGEQQRLAPPEHHLDVATEIASVVRFLSGVPATGSIVWLHGEPGSGRGAVARLALRLAADIEGRQVMAVEVLPEMVNVDPSEAQRLRREAREDQCVLIVPIRTEPTEARLSGEVLVRVERLERAEFHALLCQLLQDRPAPEVEARLWSATGGLAGRACRTVRRLVRDGDLAWTPDGIRAALLPALLDFGNIFSGAESVLLPVLAA